MNLRIQKKYSTSHAKLTALFDVSNLFYDLQDAPVLLKTIVVSELKSTLMNSSQFSASSRRSEDVKMLRVALFTERGRYWKHSWDYKISILFFFFACRIVLKTALWNVPRRTY